ncbi:MAG: Ig-like domain-containing protein, partial [Winogradskyella sp.]|nr:Ig-like domain-containing protein [Winogradskyella sp.]
NGNLRFSLGFGHSNLAVLRLDELFTFANQVSYGGDALPDFEVPSYNSSNVASVSVSAEAGLSSAELLYTTGEGYWYERVWQAIPATITGNTITANLPDSTTTFYFTATDSRGLMTSSEYVEIDTSSIPSGNPNIAVYGAASQSSTDYLGEASRAIDQNTNGKFNGNSVTHTMSEDNAWWQVELIGSHSIDEIVIFNRTDASSKSRLTNFTVYVINSKEEITFSQSFNSYPDPSVTIDAGGADGHIIKVQLDASDTPLSLAEVEVYKLENTGISVTNVNVSPKNTTLLVGNTILLTTTVTPANATDQSVNWRSSNTSVATVNETTGLVTAKSAGSAIITATTTDGELTDNCTVTVTNSSSSSNNYFKQSYGIFVHYGFGGTAEDDFGCTISQYADGSFPQNVDETANNFDVQGFVNDLAAMSPEYLIFTIWHCGMNPLYPSAVMEDWLGPDHAGSERDVMQELLDACEAKGIDVYFYTQPSIGNSMRPTSQEAIGWINNSRYSETYNDYINEVYAEITNRYKTQFKGFWFDKGLGFGCVDAPRLGETIRAIMPNAVMIKNGFASDAPAAADYGAVEVKSVTVNLEDEGYPNADDKIVDTWPAFDRSVSFVADRDWFSNPGSIRYTSEEMYKYTVLEAGVNTEGGGVAWSLGPYPTTTISWNNGIIAGMTGLGERIDEVGESIKGTVPSSSWPTAEGARIQELAWGIATRSADGNYEYLHVLKAPTENTLTIDAPADGRKYTSAVNLRTGNFCSFSQVENEVSITLDDSDSWDQVDAVIKLSTDIVSGFDPENESEI